MPPHPIDNRIGFGNDDFAFDFAIIGYSLILHGKLPVSLKAAKFIRANYAAPIPTQATIWILGPWKQLVGVDAVFLEEIRVARRDVYVI